MTMWQHNHGTSLTFELLPGAKPLRQRVRPFRATTEHNSMDTVRKLDS